MARATPFTAGVLSAVRRIPPGRVATYGDIAALAGRPRAWRAVGNIARDSRAPGVPWHRVVASGGRLGGYGGNPAMKRALLAAEGVAVTLAGGIRNWRHLRWQGPRRLAGPGNRAGPRSVSP
jgi:methylated-DNA-[protein]-cysteine S-methyltransferase